MFLRFSYYEILFTINNFCENFKRNYFTLLVYDFDKGRDEKVYNEKFFK